MAGWKVKGNWTCGLCSHKWFGEQETGKPAPCPSCGAEAGKLDEGVAPGVGEPHVQCICGCTLWFVIIQKGHPTLQCQGCGNRQIIMMQLKQDEGEFHVDR